MISNLFVMLFASFAIAAPQVDPVLVQIFEQRRGPNDTAVTIIAFKDVQPTRAIGPSSRSYRNVREVLERNALVAQQRVCQALTRNVYCKGRDIKRVWLTNSLIVRLTRQEINYLLQFNEISSMIAGERMMKLVKPVYVSQAFPHPRQGPVEYTYGLTKMKVAEFRAANPGITGAGVNVGIIDTGIAKDHPEFQGKEIRFKDFFKKSDVAYDFQGHGSHVAGTIGGIGASKVQIGVAPQVNFTVGKIFDRNEETTDAIVIEAMNWITDPDGNPDTKDYPLVINNSWGSGPIYKPHDPASNIYCKAVNNWVSMGILPVFAAGNDGGKGTISLPAACPHALAVGATGSNDKLAYFSSGGPAKWTTGTIIKPEVSAPGVDIRSVAHTGGYKNSSGTSMAAPHVAGMAALLIQKYPGATPEQLAQLIMKMTDDLGEPGQDNSYGHGRVTLMKAGR